MFFDRIILQIWPISPDYDITIDKRVLKLVNLEEIKSDLLTWDTSNYEFLNQHVRISLLKTIESDTIWVVKIEKEDYFGFIITLGSVL